MHTTVMSCDFLLAPAYCAPESIEHRVADLAEYARSVLTRNESPLLESDAVNKLIEAGKYPCEGLFKNNLAKVKEEFFTAKDIARIVSNILINGKGLEYSDYQLWECSQSLMQPSFSQLSPNRLKELEELVEEVSIFNELEAKDHSILHYCPINSFPEIEYTGNLDEIAPQRDLVLPHPIKRITRLFSDYREYLTSISYFHDLSENRENAVLLKEAIFWGVVCDLKNRNLPLSSFDPSDFDLGDNFVDSLREHQCLPGQNFWGSCFSSIVAVLSRDPAYEINIFSKTGKCDKQREHGRYKAYRSHVTKGGVGLRLLFWQDDDDYIELANIGPKHELKIEVPRGN
ncbi:hypothetical protein ACLPHM_01945 [Paenalcaligenes sp. Me131]|uniref:hypothetical protein n=1 Tax=Paenalcaligenes sp. Me131 TaxID=3392636 RepID=UPI003D2C6109